MTLTSPGSKRNQPGLSSGSWALAAGISPKAFSCCRYFTRSGEALTSMNHCHLVTPSASLHSWRSACVISSPEPGARQKARLNTRAGSPTVEVGGGPFHEISAASSEARPSTHRQAAQDSKAMTGIRIRRIFFIKYRMASVMVDLRTRPVVKGVHQGDGIYQGKVSINCEIPPSNQLPELE